jgi:hypothetical protein
MNYEKLKITELKKLAEEYDIPTNTTKDIIIKNLKLVDSGKYIYETTCEKYNKDTYLIGVDIKNQEKLMACGKFVDNGQISKSRLYSTDRIYFESSFKWLG